MGQKRFAHRIRHINRLIGIVICVQSVWAVQTWGTALGREPTPTAQAGREDRRYQITSKGKKVGYSRYQRSEEPVDGGVRYRISTTTLLRYTRLFVSYETEIREEALVDQTDRLLECRIVVSEGKALTVINGRRDETAFRFEVDKRGKKTVRSVPLQNYDWSTYEIGLRLRHAAQPGEALQIRLLDPLEGAVVTGTIRVTERTSVMVQDRREDVILIESHFGRHDSRSWIDDHGLAIREDGPDYHYEWVDENEARKF